MFDHFTTLCMKGLTYIRGYFRLELEGLGPHGKKSIYDNLVIRFDILPISVVFRTLSNTYDGAF